MLALWQHGLNFIQETHLSNVRPPCLLLAYRFSFQIQCIFILFFFSLYDNFTAITCLFWFGWLHIYIYIYIFYPCCVSSTLFSLGLARWNTVNNMSFLHCTTLLSKKGRIYGYPYLRSKAWLKKVFIYVINHCVCTQLNTATKYCHWYLLQIIQVT